MKFKSTFLGQASGSLNGSTFSRNRFGPYVRTRAVPVNPNTAYQVALRAVFAALVTRWTETLTDAQRDAWTLYAANVPVVGPLGDPQYLTGQNWYIGCNTPRLQAKGKIALSSIDVVDDGPTTYDRGTFTTPTPTLSEASGLSTAFNNGDDWANEDDAFLLVYEGRPMSPTRNFFKGPFRLVGLAEGDSGTPPTSPLALSASTLTNLGYTVTEGQGVSVKYVVCRGDGRLSTPQIVGPSAVGA